MEQKNISLIFPRQKIKINNLRGVEAHLSCPSFTIQTTLWRLTKLKFSQFYSNRSSQYYVHITHFRALSRVVSYANEIIHLQPCFYRGSAHTFWQPTPCTENFVCRYRNELRAQYFTRQLRIVRNIQICRIVNIGDKLTPEILSIRLYRSQYYHYRSKSVSINFLIPSDAPGMGLGFFYNDHFGCNYC